ncbi:PsbP-related protein [Chloroflexota bacterium]
MTELKYRIIALCLILTLVITTGCGNTSNEIIEEPSQAPLFITYSDEINGFSIQYPGEWLPMPAESLESAIIGFSSLGEYPDSNVKVIVSRISLASKMTVSAFYEKLIKDIYSQTGYSLHSKQEQSINNRHVIKLLYSFNSEEFSFKGTRLLLVQNNYGWIITCISDHASFEDLEPTFNEIYGSFNFTGSTNTAEPVINYFSVNKGTISEGESIILSWNVSNASYITVLPMVSSVDLIGNKQLSPTISTSYTLIAYNDFGSSSQALSVTVNPRNQNIVGYDPVTGRNSSIGFTWEQLCYADEYQVQIAKDPGFTLMVFDSGVFAPASSTSPALLYGAGGVLEAGHTYYWRARVRGTVTGEQIYGHWSLPQSFTISSGNPVTTPYYGVQLLSPNNNCNGYPVEYTAFSWSPFQETNKYRFTLARKADMTDILVTTELSKTSYEYSGKLDYNTKYYWQVMAIEPAPSDPSAVFSFTTEALQLQEPEISETPSEPSPEVPIWAWVLIGLGIILIIIVIIFIFRARRP